MSRLRRKFVVVDTRGATPAPLQENGEPPAAIDRVKVLLDSEVTNELGAYWGPFVNSCEVGGVYKRDGLVLVCAVGWME